MKKIAINTVLILFLISCSKTKSEDIQPKIISNWKLTEILMDPGDGSGTFQAVQSNRILQFKDNNQVVCNEKLCEMTSSSAMNSTGTYSESEESIIPTDCQNSKIKYKINEDTLILFYQCFEACESKYIRIN